MISNMEVSLVFFSSFRNNILVFLIQSFQHLNIEHEWGQLSCNHYVSLYVLSHPVPCFLVWLFSPFVFISLVLISRDFQKSLWVFLILFRKIALPIKCLLWPKSTVFLAFIYLKGFLLSIDFIKCCNYIKKVTQKTLAHILLEDINLLVRV